MFLIAAAAAEKRCYGTYRSLIESSVSLSLPAAAALSSSPDVVVKDEAENVERIKPGWIQGGTDIQRNRLQDFTNSNREHIAA